MNKSGFKNAAADKIWNDHLGNNAYVRHRNGCSTCLEAHEMRVMGAGYRDCADGERIFNEMLEEIVEKIDEALLNQN